MCRALLGERFPDHDILAEELGGAATAGRSHRWVFDPLDGTTNFAHGVPIFCASLGLEIDGEAVVGAVFDPNRHELFTAERGVGAWLNGTPIRVSSTAALIDALLVTGFPYDVHATLDQVIGLFSAFVGEARAVRRLGSAAIDLCWVAAGRMDGFWEERLQPWDTCAAALLVQEAGGHVTGLDGGRGTPRPGTCWRPTATCTRRCVRSCSVSAIVAQTRRSDAPADERRRVSDAISVFVRLALHVQ